MAINYILLIATCYLLGSIPSGFLIVKLVRGMDIRQVGSGNIGATNVTRILGKPWGFTCFGFDFLKGFVATFFLPALFFEIGDHLVWVKLVAAVAVVGGHNWTCFLKFKGGKGVATAAGSLFGMTPIVVLTCLLIWILVLLFSKMVSLSSIIASFCLPVVMWLYQEPRGYLILGCLLAVISLVRHKENMKRIWQGTENKIGKRIR